MAAIPARLVLLADDPNALRLVVAWAGLDYAGNDDRRLFTSWGAAAGVPLPEVYRCARFLRAGEFVREQRVEGITRPLRTADPDAIQLAQVVLASQLGAGRGPRRRPDGR